MTTATASTPSPSDVVSAPGYVLIRDRPLLDTAAVAELLGLSTVAFAKALQRRTGRLIGFPVPISSRGPARLWSFAQVMPFMDAEELCSLPPHVLLDPRVERPSARLLSVPMVEAGPLVRIVFEARGLVGELVPAVCFGWTALPACSVLVSRSGSPDDDMLVDSVVLEELVRRHGVDQWSWGDPVFGLGAAVASGPYAYSVGSSRWVVELLNNEDGVSEELAALFSSVLGGGPLPGLDGRRSPGQLLAWRPGDDVLAEPDDMHNDAVRALHRRGRISTGRTGLEDWFILDQDSMTAPDPTLVDALDLVVLDDDAAGLVISSHIVPFDVQVKAASLEALHPEGFGIVRVPEVATTYAGFILSRLTGVPRHALDYGVTHTGKLAVLVGDHWWFLGARVDAADEAAMKGSVYAKCAQAALEAASALEKSLDADMEKIRWFSIAEVAERLALSDKTVRRMIRAGEINAVRVPGDAKNRPWRISEDSLREVFSRTTS